MQTTQEHMYDFPSLSELCAIFYGSITNNLIDKNGFKVDGFDEAIWKSLQFTKIPSLAAL